MYKYINTSNQQTVHLKLMQCYMSILSHFKRKLIVEEIDAFKNKGNLEEFLIRILRKIFKNVISYKMRIR